MRLNVEIRHIGQSPFLPRIDLLDLSQQPH